VGWADLVQRILGGFLLQERDRLNRVHSARQNCDSEKAHLLTAALVEGADCGVELLNGRRHGDLGTTEGETRCGRQGGGGNTK
jgi:hypothetical protein